MTTAFEEPNSIDDRIAKLSLLINRLKALGLDTHRYYNAENDAMYDLDAYCDQLRTPGAQGTIAQIFAAIEFPAPFVSESIVIGLVRVPDPAEDARIQALISEIKQIIQRMEAKNLDPRKVYDIKKDTVIDLRLLLESYINGPKIAL